MMSHFAPRLVLSRHRMVLASTLCSVRSTLVNLLCNQLCGRPMPGVAAMGFSFAIETHADSDSICNETQLSQEGELRLLESCTMLNGHCKMRTGAIPRIRQPDRSSHKNYNSFEFPECVAIVDSFLYCQRNYYWCGWLLEAMPDWLGTFRLLRDEDFGAACNASL